MLAILDHQKIYVYTQPIDMRKAINGLVIILLETFQQVPQSGDLYLFVSKDRKKIKCLLWDNNGFVLYHKRLEKGRFNYSNYLKNEEIIISEKQLRVLLMGLDFYLLNEHAAEKYHDFF